MRKILLTVLSVILTFSFYGCSEETIETETGPVITRVNTAALDAENSYFLFTVSNVSPVSYELPDNESDPNYNAIMEMAKNQGVYVKVFGNEFDNETVVLNGDFDDPNSGMITNTNENVLVVVRQAAGTSTSADIYEIQILLKAREAAASKGVEITIGNNVYIYNDWELVPARSWYDEEGNEVTSIYIPESTNGSINLISVPNDAPIYTYDPNSREFVAALANYDITDQLESSLANSAFANKITLTDYTIEADEESGTEGLAGCLTDGTGICGITLSATNLYNYEADNLTLPMSTIVYDYDYEGSTAESIIIYHNTDLLFKGTVVDDVEVTGLASKYLDLDNSVAVFDIKAVNGGSFTANDITVAGSYSLLSDTDLEGNSKTASELEELTTAVSDAYEGSLNIPRGYYVIETIDTDNYRLFINAQDAAYAAENGYLSITVNDKTILFDGTEVQADTVSHAYFGDSLLPSSYRITSTLVIDIIPTYFGPTPTYYEYDVNDEENSYTKALEFTVGTPSVSNGSSINVSYDCLSIDSCTLTVEPNGNDIYLGDEGYEELGYVNISYTNANDETSGELQNLPTTSLYFYTDAGSSSNQ